MAQKTVTTNVCDVCGNEVTMEQRHNHERWWTVRRDCNPHPIECCSITCLQQCADIMEQTEKERLGQQK